MLFFLFCLFFFYKDLVATLTTVQNFSNNKKIKYFFDLFSLRGCFRKVQECQTVVNASMSKKTVTLKLPLRHKRKCGKSRENETLRLSVKYCLSLFKQLLAVHLIVSSFPG